MVVMDQPRRRPQARAREEVCDQRPPPHGLLRQRIKQRQDAPVEGAAGTGRHSSGHGSHRTGGERRRTGRGWQQLINPHLHAQLDQPSGDNGVVQSENRRGVGGLHAQRRKPSPAERSWRRMRCHPEIAQRHRRMTSSTAGTPTIVIARPPPVITIHRNSYPTSDNIARSALGTPSQTVRESGKKNDAANSAHPANRRGRHLGRPAFANSFESAVDSPSASHAVLKARDGACSGVSSSSNSKRARR